MSVLNRKISKGQSVPKADEFLWIFFAGLLAISVLLFAWGTPSTGENETGNITQTQGVFTVGAESTDVPQIYRIGHFGISYTSSSDVLAKSRYIEVKKGLFIDQPFSMSGKIDSNLDNVVDGWITMDLLGSNSAGNLVVKVNNKVVYDQKTNPGQINIPVDKSTLTKYNVIEVSCGTPGLQFWSTTTYRIETIEFGVNQYGNVRKNYEFQTSSQELKSFTDGRVVLTVADRQGTGNLIIKINDKLVFNGIPSSILNQPFGLFDVGLVNGANHIEFSTEQGTSYSLEDVQLQISHKETGLKSKSFTFTINDNQMEKLNDGVKGRIKFVIVDSDLLGSLIVKTTDTNGVDHQLNIIQSYSIGKSVSIDFGPNDVGAGTNIVTFSVSGDGQFTLSNMEIVV